MTAAVDPTSPLNGIRVIDISTLIAAPLVATYLGDFGADVLKVEHPRGDPVRTHGAHKDGIPLWWKLIGRNKRCITLDLSQAEGSGLLLELVKDADVLVENFRPGTLERWGLGPDVLRDVAPGLIVARVTGFGQFGPYSGRPGFGTLAESMSGFAHITGEPEGPPTLPPFGLADGIASLAGALAVMMALFHRDAGGGRGQTIDLAIIEPILTILGPQPIIYDQLGLVQERTGNRSRNNAPRNTYRARDGRWLAVASSATSIAERVMVLVGRTDLTREPWFASGHGRADHADEIDAAVADWIAARDTEEVIAAFDAAGAAVAPVYSVADVMKDAQYSALRSIVRVPDDELGDVAMQNVMFRMSDTPGSVRWAGRAKGADNRTVYSELGISAERLADLHERGVI
jgi:crotonobetainyl-CoA:carnitine CoA-transferase CaiB-like acyl-CoA transferase